MTGKIIVGPALYTDGNEKPLRGGRTGEGIVTQLHGKFFEQMYRGNVYRQGMTVTALSANTITLVAATTPITGLWNPKGSDVLVIPILALCPIVVAGNSAVAPGGLVWATSEDNGLISTGKNPINCKTWKSPGGAKAKAFDISTALTGLTNNLVIQRAANLGTLLAAQGATASPIMSTPNFEIFDGIEAIPPGGVLALLNTVSTTTVSVGSAIYWAEVPL